MFSDVLVHADPFAGIEAANLPEPPESLLDICRAATPGQPVENERRQHPRYDVATTALVRPIDKNFRPAGAAFRAAVRDISAGGLRMLHTRYVGAHLLAVRLGLSPGRTVTVAMTVLRSQPRRGYCEIAGSILARLDGPADELV